MKKQRLIIMILAALLVGLAIALAPLPQRVNITLSGVKTADASEEENVEISIKGWYLNYLFRKDNLKGTVSIIPYDYETANQAVYEFLGLFSPPDTDMQFCTLVRYSAALDVNVFGTIIFNEDFHTVLIVEDEFKDGYYAASKENLDDTGDTIERFKDFIYR